jgi:hypothetical protein
MLPKHPEATALSPLRRQAADAVRRARKLPVGPARNDLRQLAIGLRWLEKRGPSETRQRAAAEAFQIGSEGGGRA